MGVLRSADRLKVSRMWKGKHIVVILFIAFLLASCRKEPVPVAQAPLPSGSEIFKEKCAGCHELQRALLSVKGEDAWLATIKRMQEYSRGGITNQEIDILVRFHVSRQQEEASLFKEKCRKCHPSKRIADKNLTPEQTRALVLRMQQKAGNLISDADVDIIVNYHIKAQRVALQSTLQRIVNPDAEPLTESKGSVVSLFLERCSTCHEPNVAMAVFKDEVLWRETIKRMQQYSDGAISDDDAGQIINLHVSEQRTEVDTFRKTCTRCHTEERVEERSLSADEWFKVIRRMQQKAPELITDEKVEIVAAYFHRREMTMASLFYDRCNDCHKSDRAREVSVKGNALDVLIQVVREKFAGEVQHQEIQTILSLHSQRQQREMEIFKQACSTCHPAGEKKKGSRSADEWVLFISELQNRMVDSHVENSVATQIRFHTAGRK
jgi:mono/diheme cytochrome c family protein